MTAKSPGEYSVQGKRFAQVSQGYTLAKLSNDTKISISMLSQLKSGRTLPSDTTLGTLRKLFGEEAIASIGWPRAKSPLTRANIVSKSAPPGSFGAKLKELRLTLPGPPDQTEVAIKLGIKPKAYTYMEQGGGERMLAKKEFQEKLLALFGEDLREFLPRYSQD